MAATVGPAARAGGRRRSSLAELWEYRELLRSLASRTLKVKYKRSVLGFAWTLLNPLLTVAILAAVFGTVVRLDVPHYWAFLVSGFFVWNFVSLVLNAGTRVLAEHAALARSVAIPAQVFVLAAVAARLVEFLLEMLLFVVALAVFHHHGVPASFAALPALVVCLVMIVTGVVLPIAALSAFYDDVQHALPVVLLMVFYVTPVFYPLRLVPERALVFYRLNPFAELLTAFQAVLYEGVLPAPGSVLAIAVWAVGLWVTGFGVFDNYKRIFVEIV